MCQTDINEVKKYQLDMTALRDTRLIKNMECCGTVAERFCLKDKVNRIVESFMPRSEKHKN